MPTQRPNAPGITDTPLYQTAVAATIITYSVALFIVAPALGTGNHSALRMGLAVLGACLAIDGGAMFLLERSGKYYGLLSIPAELALAVAFGGAALSVYNITAWLSS